MTLETLNALDLTGAERELLRCCGAVRWARRMAGRRPFPDFPSLERDADTIWMGLDAADWLEAFAAHPKIGDGTAGRAAGDAGEAAGARTVDEAGRVNAEAKAGRTSEWSSREQAGMQAADPVLRQRLATVNREYEDRFGFIFIVCATGKSAAELLAIAEQRLTRSPEEELLTAAEEQRKITRIRLAKLVT